MKNCAGGVCSERIPKAIKQPAYLWIARSDYATILINRQVVNRHWQLDRGDLGEELVFVEGKHLNLPGYRICSVDISIKATDDTIRKGKSSIFSNLTIVFVVVSDVASGKRYVYLSLLKIVSV